MGLDELLGLVVTDVAADKVVGRIVIDERHLQPYGVVHGGVYASMVETLASYGAATWAMEQNMAGAVGIHNSTDFIRSCREGELLGEARPIHRGRTQQLWEVDVRTEGGKLVARGRVRLQNLTDIAAIVG